MADFFDCPLDQSITEIEVMKSFEETMKKRNEVLFSQIRTRSKGMDPPDCEATNMHGERVAIEVTELVDGIAIHKYKLAQKNKTGYEFAEWNKEKFIDFVQDRVTEKSARFPKLKGTPYPGGYIIVIYTDEFFLTSDIVAGFIQDHRFNISHPCRIFFLLSHEPKLDCCPYLELKLKS